VLKFIKVMILAFRSLHKQYLPSIMETKLKNCKDESGMCTKDNNELQLIDGPAMKGLGSASMTGKLTF
jgi:hypothetical protein